MSISERPYSVKEYAERLGVSGETVYRWIRDGHLACLRLPGGDIRIRQRDAMAFEGETVDTLVTCPKPTAEEAGCNDASRLVSSVGRKVDPIALAREMREAKRRPKP